MWTIRNTTSCARPTLLAALAVLASAGLSAPAGATEGDARLAAPPAASGVHPAGQVPTVTVETEVHGPQPAASANEVPLRGGWEPVACHAVPADGARYLPCQIMAGASQSSSAPKRVTS